MKKIARRPILSALLMLMAGCAGGTPDCGAGATLDLLGRIVEESFQKSAHGRRMRPLVDYEIKSIRTSRHDAGRDAWQCSADLDIRPRAGGGGQAQSHRIEYEVHAAPDRGAGYEIIYFNIDEAVLRAAAARSLGSR